MRRPGILLAGCIIASFILYYIITYFGDTIDSLDRMRGTDGLGAVLAMTLSVPFVFVYALATLFCWISYFGRIRGLSLTGGILYCVCVLLMVPWFAFVIFPAIFAFAGYVRQGDIEFEEARKRKKHKQVVVINANGMTAEELSCVLKDSDALETDNSNDDDDEDDED